MIIQILQVRHLPSLLISVKQDLKQLLHLRACIMREESLSFNGPIHFSLKPLKMIAQMRLLEQYL